MLTHTLHSEALSVEIRMLGAALNRVVARTAGAEVDLVLGHADDADRAASTYYLGALVGPVANRIANGRFTLDGVTHQLATNDRGNTLHGGPDGFSTRPWTLIEAGPDAATLALGWTDPAGGLPGHLAASVTYRLRGNELSQTLAVASDTPTLAAPCLHPYFNLAGSGTIRDHVVAVRAGRVLFTAATSIPTGPPVEVAGTPFDLRGGVRLGDVMDSDHPQVAAASGLDHAFLLDPGDGPAAVLTDPASGRRLEIWTDQPSIQVFTGVDLSTDAAGLGGVPYPDFGGVALEAQQVPDTANRTEFGSVRIDAEHPFRSTTRYVFTLA